jgi:hypothetical protein
VDEKASLITGNHSVLEEGQSAKAFFNLPKWVAGDWSYSSAVCHRTQRYDSRRIQSPRARWGDGHYLGDGACGDLCWRFVTDRFPHSSRRCGGGDQQFGDRDLPTRRIRSDTAQGVYRSRVSRDVHCCHVAWPRRIFIGCAPVWASRNHYSQRASALAALIQPRRAPFEGPLALSHFTRCQSDR